MTHDLIFSNAMLVLRDQVTRGSLLVRDGVIVDVTPGGSAVKGGVDCNSDYLAPGLVELHTDNLERHIQPRPKVDWPHRAAILAHDREMAGTGITTVFDAIRVGSILSDGGARYGKYARRLADQVIEMRDAGALKISHHIHLRAEVCSETLEDELEEFGPADKVGIVSLMDHTPGQRQFRDLAKFENYVRSKKGMEADVFAQHVQRLYDLQSRFGGRHTAAAVAAAARYGATLASHDDTTMEQVETSAGQGVRIGEFPTTLEAAQTCRRVGIATVMGAPNLVRGSSHSGNVAAGALAENGLLDILSSDYVPAALLQGAVMLAQGWGDMARAIATVTHTPARAAGLTDRGALAVGQRADLVRFGVLSGVPLVQGVWCQGARVA